MGFFWALGREVNFSHHSALVKSRLWFFALSELKVISLTFSPATGLKSNPFLMPYLWQKSVGFFEVIFSANLGSNRANGFLIFSWVSAFPP